MIKAILIFNNHGKPRLSKFYEHYTEDTEQQIIRETFHLVSKRDENVCNFLEGGLLIGGSENKLIYRHYATLYFVFCVDSSESELGILDLIQVFVETLDKCFENVCELDLIFHMDKVHNILAEMVMGGMVLETNMSEIITQVEAQTKMEKSEVRATRVSPSDSMWDSLLLPLRGNKPKRVASSDRGSALTDATSDHLHLTQINIHTCTTSSNHERSACVFVCR
ncbi:AP-3 complex subunit sigma-1 [Anabarilius grahami]|uniref:AP-3 complex subunit sigma-1 n=1 Tax=Anabarilius grahami TaxID=495550 RepID=A0A3N0Z664_ANAGA|nr:AP-3 complex subunit sigma-1 [Anabarilius grahami]